LNLLKESHIDILLSKSIINETEAKQLKELIATTEV
jgi:hypothetical protein